MLMIKGESEKVLQKKIAQKIFEMCHTNEKVYVLTLRLIVKSLRYTYNPDDMFQCHYASYLLLDIVIFLILVI